MWILIVANRQESDFARVKFNTKNKDVETQWEWFIWFFLICCYDRVGKSDRDELVTRVWLEKRKIISLGEIAWNSSFMKKILAVQPKIFVTGEPKHPVTPWRPSCHTDLGKWEVMGDFTTRWLSARGCKCVTGNREWGSPALTPQGCPRADWMKMVRMSGILQLFNSKSTKITHIPWFRQILIKSNQYTYHSFTAYIHLVTRNGHNMNGLNILMQPKRIVS